MHVRPVLHLGCAKEGTEGERGGGNNQGVHCVHCAKLHLSLSCCCQLSVVETLVTPNVSNRLQALGATSHISTVLQVHLWLATMSSLGATWAWLFF